MSTAERTRLEDRRLPGDDWPAPVRAALRELIERITQAGHDVDLHTLGRFLADFTPQLPPERAEEWTERARARWLNETKPSLVELLADHFLNGRQRLPPGP